MTTLATPAGAGANAPAAARSEGVWHAAWRRFKTDRVGVVCAVIVLSFLVLIAFSALGVVAKSWQAEVGLANVPPTFNGPRPPEAVGTV